MRKIKILAARDLRQGDLILHARRRFVITKVSPLFAFVQIEATALADSTGVELTLHGRRKLFVMREDTHGSVPQPVPGVRDRSVFLRRKRPVLPVPGNGDVRDVPWLSPGGPASGSALRLGLGDRIRFASPAELPTWTGPSGMEWRGTVPFVPARGTGDQRQVPLVSRDGAWRRATEVPLGEGGVVPGLRPTIPAQRGPALGDDRPAERSGFVRVENILAGLHSLTL